MENQSKMLTGTWERINSENYDDKEKVKFEINITQRVVILNPNPKELIGEDGGAYYMFDIEQDKKPKVLQTSAWTLLKALKAANLREGMIIDITKRIKQGKQYFEVIEVK